MSNCLGVAVRACAALVLLLQTACAVVAPARGAEGCDAPLTPSIENSCIVSPNVLWRGSKPSAAGMATLIETGVRTIVNLQWLDDDKELFERAEIPSGADREVRYFWIHDWEPLVIIAPKNVDDNIAQFIAITRTQPTPIFVHCRAGKNRTGVMVAAYRIFNGMSVEDSIAEMKTYGGRWFKHDARYLRTLTPQRIQALERRIADWIPKVQATSRIVCKNGRCSAADE